MRTEGDYPSLDYFKKYGWYLKALNTKLAEYSKISSDISRGLLSRDTVDPEWQRSNRREIRELKSKMQEIVYTINSMPDRLELIPCKLFLQLHYVLGLNLTETAEKLNVSQSTVRRIRDRAGRYFENYLFDEKSGEA